MRAIVASISIFFLLLEAAFGAEQVSRTHQLPTLAMNQKQLSRFVKSINDFVSEANSSNAGCKSRTVEVKISDASTAIEFSAAQIAEELNGLPEVAFRLDVNYYCSSGDPPITNVSMELGDYSRESIIRGFRIEQVDALSSIRNSCQTAKCLLGLGRGRLSYFC
jgi:hypothetical protein